MTSTPPEIPMQPADSPRAATAVPQAIYSSLESTRTSFNGWLSRSASTDVPPLIDVIIGGRIVRKTRPYLAADSHPPVWKFGCQWLKPLDTGTTIELRFAETGQRLAATTVDFRDGKHAMHSRAFNYAVFYNPKSACTSIRNLFFALHADEMDPLRPDNAIRNAPTIFPLGKECLPEFKINVVRDPYRRLISSFIDKVASLFYHPQLCTGHEVYRWRFGSKTEPWGDLTFLDFLDYLAEHRDFADLHFHSQPLITGDVEIVRVEDLETQLCDVYRRRRPELLDRVKAFFNLPMAHANRSLNNQYANQVELGEPHVLSVRDLGAIIQSGKGFSGEKFISPATLPAMNALLDEEIRCLGYTLLDASGAPAASHGPDLKQP